MSLTYGRYGCNEPVSVIDKYIYIYIYKPVRKDMSGSSCITARVGTAIYIAAWIPGSRPLVIAKHYVLVLAG